MANAAEVVLWYEQQRYKALDKALKAEGTTVEKELEKSLDVLYARLVPETERAAIEKNLAQEEERMAALRARQKAESYRVPCFCMAHTAAAGSSNAPGRCSTWPDFCGLPCGSRSRQWSSLSGHSSERWSRFPRTHLPQ